VLRGWADEVRAGRLLGQRRPRPTSTASTANPAARATARPTACRAGTRPAAASPGRTPSRSSPPSSRSASSSPTTSTGSSGADDTAADFYRELGELRAQLRAVNRNTEDKPLSGWCYRIVDDQGTVCGGSLWPEYETHTSGAGAEDDGGRRRPREVVCGRNSTHRWKGGRYGDLAELYAALERQRPEARHRGRPPRRRRRRPCRTSTGLQRPDRLIGLIREDGQPA
jgi:hypothetical protein